MRRRQLIARARGVINVNALVAAGLVVGLLSNVLIAALFGLSRRVDAFFAAWMLPNLFMVLCIDYLGKNFLPVLGAAKRIGEDCAGSVTSSIVTIVALLATAVTAALFLLREPVFALLLPGFDVAELELVGSYFAIMAPSMVLMAVNTFHEYVWQYEERFTYISLTRLALPLANCAGVLALGPWLGEYCLPIAYLVGHATAFLLLLRGLPYRYRPQIALRPNLERRVFANAAVVMSTGIVARSRSIVVNFMASQLGSGAISALAFARKLTEPLERTVFTGVKMLMFSHSVRLVVADDRAGLAALYDRGLRAAFLVLSPLIAWIALDSRVLVELIFARGKFTPEMASVVGGVLLALSPTVIFAGVNQLLSNAFYAMDRVKVPAVVMPFGMLVYIAGAIPLSTRLGAQGLAAASSLAAAVVFGVMLRALARQLPELAVWRLLARVGAYALLAGTAMLGALTALGSLGLSPLAAAAAALPLGAAAYAGALHFAGDRTFRALLSLVRAYAGETSKAHL
jgi:putative peptidoglycan lipid II flippase